jgi:ferric-dicitrate binding protein FerR (iron transport regulator)
VPSVPALDEPRQHSERGHNATAFTATTSASSDTSEPSNEALFTEASAWFARLHAEDVSGADRCRFDRWLRHSPAHAHAWREVQELFEALHVPAIITLEHLKQQGDDPFKPSRSLLTSDAFSKGWRKRLRNWMAAGLVKLIDHVGRSTPRRM